MVRRLALLVAGLLGALVAPTALAAPVPRRVIAVGDLHGDFSAWSDIERASGIVDGNGHWAAGNTILVQMGDITDREADSLKIIRNLQQLEREAPHEGGRVIVVLGNHEAMNLLGDNRYTTAGEYAAFADKQSAARRDRIYEANRTKLEATAKAKNPAINATEVRSQWMAEHPLGWVEHQLAWAPSGALGRWATGNAAIVKIDGTLFVHGGISAEYARQPLDSVNARVKAAMSVADDSPTSVLSDPLGPPWYRGMVENDTDALAARASMKAASPPLTQAQELTTVLTAYGAQRVVVAHTPDLTGIKITNDGKLARIDTGISRYYGGPLEWLEISGERMIVHATTRTH